MTPNSYMKIPPSTRVKKLGIHINNFLLFGIIGYILGTAFGLIMTLKLDLDVLIILSMSLVAVGVFFILVLLAKWILKEEIIVYYHHEIVIMITCAFVLFLLNRPILQYLDITLLGIGVFVIFGRVGCYSVGCCHGRPYKHGVIYGEDHVKKGFTWYYKNVPLLPVQLIESGYVLLTVITGALILFSHKQPGTVIIVYTVFYGLMRFTLEYFRGDPERPFWLGLSEAQWTSVSLIFITFLMSQANWLPAYNWHWIVLVGLLIVMLGTIYFYKNNPFDTLFIPRQVRQFAEGLVLLENASNNLFQGQKPGINIYTTSNGLSVSRDNVETDRGNIKCYTISCKNRITISSTLAHRIARLISNLENEGADYELIEKQNGIYHILFINKEQNLYKRSVSN